MDKIVIDLNHPVWLSEPGYISECWSLDSERLCALGKFNICVGLNASRLSTVYDLYKEITGLNANSIADINDKYPLCAENHYKAVRLLLENLAKSDKVEFKGTFVSDILKQKELENASI